MKYYTSRKWESDYTLFCSVLIYKICSLKWCSMRCIIVNLSSAPILQHRRHLLYERSSSAAIVSSPRGFLGPSFVLQTSAVSYLFFKISSSAAIVSSPRGFLSPYFVLRTTFVSYSFHERSSSADIVSPFIICFTDGFCLLFVLQMIPIGCHLQPILRLCYPIVFIDDQHVVRYERHQLSPDQH